MSNIAISGSVIAKVVDAATTTGASAILFTVQPKPGGGDRTLALQAIGVVALPTTATATVEASFDGGTTWQAYASGLALVATTTGVVRLVLNVVCGLLYRINLTTYTAGSATSTSVYATAS